MSDLNTGLAKLRGATEWALGYPDATITRAEAHAILEGLDECKEMARDLMDALNDAEKGLGRAMRALRKEASVDVRKLAHLDTKEAWEQTVLKIAQYTTVNA